MSDVLGIEAIVDMLVNTPEQVDYLPHPLPNDVADSVVAELKAQADRHWWIDATVSLALGECIIKIGQQRADARQEALGMMTKGDALRLLSQFGAAWEMLNAAGQKYREAGDEIGWARTRIGRLYISINVQRVQEALRDADEAERIFVRHNDQDKHLRLKLNLGAVYNFQGQHQQALRVLDDALHIATDLGEAGERYLGIIHTNRSYAYHFLSDFRAAQACCLEASAIFEATGETTAFTTTQLNIAHLDVVQGHYREALKRLHHLERAFDANLKYEHAQCQREMIECYLALNRHDAARSLAETIIASYAEEEKDFWFAHTLLYLARTQTELGVYEAVDDTLGAAEQIYHNLEAEAWVAAVRLLRGHVALRQGDPDQAVKLAQEAAEVFVRCARQVDHAQARALEADALFAGGQYAAARRIGHELLQSSQRLNNPELRYSAHLLLGHIARAEQHPRKAIRRYQAAAATIERVQHGLTIAMRPNFPADQDRALRCLIALHLESKQPAAALEALERAKSQLWLEYILNREHLRWPVHDAYTQELIAELDRLREEYHWFYSAAQHRGGGDSEEAVVDADQALSELRVRERKMRAITEQLYLQPEMKQSARQAHTSLAEIQAQIQRGRVLIEYYNDGHNLWAFCMDAGHLQAHHLPITIDELDQLQGQLAMNINRALRAGPQSAAARSLTHLFNRTAGQLYAALIEPLAEHIEGHSQIVIVPYGGLHYLPFNLLYDGEQYLIERHEIVLLPAAGLIAHQSTPRPRAALILANSNDGRLPHVLQEAKMVQSLLVGQRFCETAADRRRLQAEPVQVLHIAAHGEYRMDQPDFSYLHLADGQLFADDLIQYDLGYELVTLSACETGKAHVAPGDEVIGLGHSLLYAGAGSIIASLWRVEDTRTATLMHHLYTGLRRGHTKAQALREAQLRLFQREAPLHPAYWGAFELIGHAGALSAP